MILRSQRRLAAEILGVGKNKILFDKNRLDEIKKAITKADVRELVKEGAIKIRIVKKIKTKKKVRKRRGIGSIKMRVSERKKRYVKRIRKLRRYINEIYDKKIINAEEKKILRKLAKAGEFKSLRNMKEYIINIMNKNINEK